MSEYSQINQKILDGMDEETKQTLSGIDLGGIKTETILNIQNQKSLIRLNNNFEELISLLKESKSREDNS